MRAVAVGIVGIIGTTGIGKGRGSIVSSDPFLIDVTPGINVGIIIDIIEIIQRTMFIVHTCIEDCDDHVIATITKGLHGILIDIGISNFHGWN